jgi:S-adenosylmethionine:tRNA ribosyltransferase-isomerase
MSYQIDSYDYDLPKHLIAQDASLKRDQSRLLVFNRNTGQIAHTLFNHLMDYLNPGDVLVLNNTRVVPARLKGRKETGGKVEVFVLDYTDAMHQWKEKGIIQCLCMIKASKAPKKGMIIYFQTNDWAIVKTTPEAGKCVIEFECKTDFLTFLNTIGHTPLPPYIHRQASQYDKNRYQTIYAKNNGAVAAPTAGLHFTESLFQELSNHDIETLEITLHVGYGTFMPVRVTNIRDHAMHAEYIEISKDTAENIQKAQKNGQRIIAVGTTTVRTLEYVYQQQGVLEAYQGYCDLFIYPGYSFHVVDAMITNFHLPKSTLLMMISAFADRKNILNVYQKAIEQEYRFFSYGDAMMII